MKTIGLLGGMSWHSTLEYYKHLNEGVQARLGQQHSAKIVLVSVDFQEILTPWLDQDWEKVTDILSAGVHSLEKAGADLFLICTNSVHKWAEPLSALTKMPLIHIADAAAKEIQSQGVKTIGLLGTKFTMGEDFYSKRLSLHGLQTIVPKDADQDLVHQIIFDELVKGITTDKSRNEYERIMRNLVSEGAQGIVLGCTEIPLLFPDGNFDVPLYDTTKIHTKMALEKAFG